MRDDDLIVAAFGFGIPILLFGAIILFHLKYGRQSYFAGVRPQETPYSRMKRQLIKEGRSKEL